MNQNNQRTARSGEVDGLTKLFINFKTCCNCHLLIKYNLLYKTVFPNKSKIYHLL